MGGKVGRTTTVAQYADTWIAGKESEDLAAQTLRNYREMLARYVLPGIGDIRLLTLRADHIRKLYSDLKARGLSGTTRLTAHRSLRAMLNTAAADGSIRRNPIKSVKAPQDDTLEKDALDPDQVVDFLAALDGSTVHGPVVVMLAAGLRRQELLALRWESVDLDVGTIAVAVKEPKSKRSRRPVPIGPDAIAALKAHQSQQKRDRLKYANKWRDEGLGFPSVTYKDEARPKADSGPRTPSATHGPRSRTGRRGNGLRPASAVTPTSRTCS